MADRVELAFRKAALRLVPEGAAVLAAVSGGADSVALLHLLARHGRGRRLRLGVAHLDHGLRPGSAADRRFVERLAIDLDLPCISDRRPVGELRRRDESPEEAARRVRRAFLLEAAAASQAALVAVGHTLDDQAETILMRLARGAGPAALAGMSRAGPGPFVRPLLGIERSELRAYLEERAIAFREDPTNRDLRFERNRVRRVVLPVLVEALNPKVARHLVESAERLREDAACLDGQARAALRRMTRSAPPGSIELPVRRLTAAAPAIARRVVRLALEQAGADPRRIVARHIEAVLGLAARPGAGRLDLACGVRARRHRESVRLAVRRRPARGSV